MLPSDNPTDRQPPMTSQASTQPASPDATASASAGAAVFDAQALDRLRELDPTGQNRLIDRVFGAFDASLLRLVPQFEAARAAADWQAVRQVAHTLKSSSASIGALALSQLCAEVESRVRQSQLDALAQPLDALAAEIARVQRALRALTRGADR